jgi:hypothetical protein
MTAHVAARVRSNPRDVVRSKKMNRCRFSRVPAPATKWYGKVEPTNGQNQKLVNSP